MLDRDGVRRRRFSNAAAADKHKPEVKPSYAQRGRVDHEDLSIVGDEE
jgi:hypothetical protein